MTRRGKRAPKPAAPPASAPRKTKRNNKKNGAAPQFPRQPPLAHRAPVPAPGWVPPPPPPPLTYTGPVHPPRTRVVPNNKQPEKQPDKQPLFVIDTIGDPSLRPSGAGPLITAPVNNSDQGYGAQLPRALTPESEAESDADAESDANAPMSSEAISGAPTLISQDGPHPKDFTFWPKSRNVLSKYAGRRFEDVMRIDESYLRSLSGNAKVLDKHPGLREAYAWFYPEWRIPA
ncbi:hypothetical protein EJ04DRAFT_561183 [Polyplosphaeria fusca]|uniref:Uncharacterized protein n=1 Tax=Polyplosphaeria fusca TaxID=682080 RepID=A0A9P4R779_9PLEO|nr:hypothetical protein EJ04DRAFT_561183 [Polyplosphaeria fusca]